MLLFRKGDKNKEKVFAIAKLLLKEAPNDINVSFPHTKYVMRGEKEVLYTILHWLAFSSHSSYTTDVETSLVLAEFCLDNGADINLNSHPDVGPPIQLAVEEGMYDVSMYYMKRGARVSNTMAWSLRKRCEKRNEQQKILKSLEDLYSVERSEYIHLTLVIHKCENLKAADRGGTSDPCMFPPLSLSPFSLLLSLPLLLTFFFSLSRRGSIFWNHKIDKNQSDKENAEPSMGTSRFC